ncbi:MAG: macro domain-containing protein, partial [Gammaproteobacteria bacterium]
MGDVTVRMGDLLASKAQTLVNTVNTVGVMGKGVALLFKQAFPDMYEDYVKRCDRGEVKLGEPYLYQRVVPPWILNFPTKGHWRSVARLDDITRGLV